jgi:hypothetical protein
MSFTGMYNSPWRWRGTATYPFLNLTYTGDRMAPWAIMSVETLHTHQSLPEPWITSQSLHIQAVLSTFVHRPRALCDKENLHDELEFLKTTFGENGYITKQIRRALNPAVRTSKPKDKPTSFAILLHVQTTYGRLYGMLTKSTSNALACHVGRPSVSVR